MKVARQMNLMGTPSLDEAQRRGVLVVPSGLYEVEPREKGGLRLTFCAEPPNRLALGGRRLGETLRAMGRGEGSARELELQAV